MKNFTLFTRLCLVLGLTSLFLVTSCQNNDLIEVQELSPLSNYTMEPIEGQYVVVLKENMSGKYATQKYSERILSLKKDYLARFSDIKLTSEKVKQTYGYGVSGFAAELNEEQLLSLRKDSRIKSIEQDYTITLNPDLSILKGKPSGGGGGSPAQVIPWGISRVGGGLSGLGKTAWIIDTGIDLTHPDLNVDKNGRNKSFLGGIDANNPNDGNGHGTHVAGTVAAIDNTIGVIGVAAGATVVAVRVLDSRGSGSYSGVIAGVEYVGANGTDGDAANMSLGGPVSSVLNDAVIKASAKVKFAIAAGNESDDANNHSPSSANGTNIYTVSAMDKSDIFAYFSNYGTSVDFCAPGVSILSLWKGGGMNTISGTSMAAPHVCGLLLLGTVNSDKTVINDPDKIPDPIAHH
ncbi:S8 family peptidase [Flavobacterium sufflavum]|uniref:S8 family peptidase n=1 Tax=Flavobacterium sufflavum TaxID=1921138 RepID=A0A437L2P3_9FLAO|nr:S8 family serine peptidase [Flavobacterium sufflavum]RVT79588.1 S8 family peptidase [Flavobacterium sufflavum]